MNTILERENVSPEVIRDALERIFSSKDFRASERKRKFLDFVVSEWLSGHANRIKAYTIAVDVFGRGDNFDPLTDPLIRIEAGRLRRSLDHYYLTDGSNDPIQISIPKGGYVPEITVVAPVHSQESRQGGQGAQTPDGSPAAPLAEEPDRHRMRTPKFATVTVLTVIVVGLAIWLMVHIARLEQVQHGLASSQMLTGLGPSLLVLPFVNASGDPSRDYLSVGLTDEIIAGLTRLQGLCVLGPGTSLESGGISDFQVAAQHHKADYVLKGSIRQIGNQIWVNAFLIAPDTNRYLWSASYEQDFNPANLLALQRDIAGQVVNALRQPNGVLFNEAVRDTGGKI